MASDSRDRQLGLGLLALLAATSVLCALLFWDFLVATYWFAYADIGSDTLSSLTPFTIEIANYLRTEGWPGWSFELGLGNNLFFFTDPFGVFNAAFGADAVLPLRIWIYVLKLFLAGGFFYLFLVAAGIRPALAVPVALAYAFCGYAAIDGQWDIFATELVLHALVLWTLVRQMHSGGVLRIPIAAALALYFTTMYFALGLFVLFVFLATLHGASDRRAVGRQWMTATWPLLVIGALLAAPRLIPFTVQMLDSPRIGHTSMLERIVAINGVPAITAQVAGLLHKDIFGVASEHRGWHNYLEAPGFFVGVLPLLLIAQLWRGSALARRLLIGGTVVVVAYIVFPAFRSIAWGFQLEYFRISTLWISILILVMHAFALEQVLHRGVDRNLLAGSALGLMATLLVLWLLVGTHIQLEHVAKIFGLMIAGLLLFGSHARGWLHARWLPAALVAYVAVEALLIVRPSFYYHRRIVPANAQVYQDATIGALKVIHASDAGFYRIEKTYDSVSLNDAMAQGYRGVKSYMLQGAGTVRFFTDLGFLAPIAGYVNHTNWVRNFGNRFALYSLVGVRYIVSRAPLDWPGVKLFSASPDLRIFRNEFALPLGVVYDRQLSRERFLKLSAPMAQDLALVNAVIVDDELPGLPQFDPAVLNDRAPDWLQAHYAGPVRALQRRGLHLTRFGNKHIEGVVHSDTAGVLAFSIPIAPGWHVSVDGREVQHFRASLGMMAVRVAAGSHRVELTHALPGLPIGFALAALGGMLWAAAGWLRRGRAAAWPPVLPRRAALHEATRS